MVKDLLSEQGITPKEVLEPVVGTQYGTSILSLIPLCRAESARYMVSHTLVVDPGSYDGYSGFTAYHATHMRGGREMYG